MIAHKAAYMQQIRQIATALAQASVQAGVMHDVYFDRGYNSGGAQAFAAEELAEAGLTQAQIDGLITLFEQIDNLRNNRPVSSGDYKAVLNQVRVDL